MSNCRFVLLAGSLGRTLAQEAHDSAPFLFPAGHVAKPLLKLACTPVLSLWLQQLRECPRLATTASISIVVNGTHYGAYMEWAEQEGFPVHNLINNGCTVADGTTPGDAADLALAISKIERGHFIFAARADCCFEPGHAQLLRHFLESAILTDRPTVAAVKGRSTACIRGLPLELSEEDSLPQGVHMAHVLQEANNTFKVDTCAIENGTSSEWRSVPCYGFPPDLADQLVDTQSSSNNTLQAHLSLDDVLKNYNRNNPITAWTCPVFFSVRTVQQLLLADYFFQHLEKKRAHIKAEKAKVLPRSRACVGAEVLLGSECPPVNLVEQAESTALSLDLEQELKHFFFDEQAALITRSQVEGKDMTLPKRFIQVQDWNYNNRRKQHPCYTTSSQDYGYKNPNKSDMPMSVMAAVWRGSKGEFTKTFAEAPRDRGLRCFTEMSKVHKRLDEFTHFR